MNGAKDKYFPQALKFLAAVALGLTILAIYLEKSRQLENQVFLSSQRSSQQYDEKKNRHSHRDSFSHKHRIIELPEPSLKEYRRSLFFDALNSKQFQLARHDLWEERCPSALGDDTYQDICEFLANLLFNLTASSVLDIGCGKMVWQRMVPSFGLRSPEVSQHVGAHKFQTINYTGLDISPLAIRRALSSETFRLDPQKAKVLAWDIITSVPPGQFDVVILRDVLGYMPLKNAVSTLSNIEGIGAKWLVVTQYIGPGENKNIDFGSWYPLNLLRAPFFLSQPQYIIEEKYVPEPIFSGYQKYLAVWSLPLRRSMVSKNGAM